jgi:hypothetical protein
VLKRRSIRGETLSHPHFPIRAALAVGDELMLAFALTDEHDARSALEIRVDLVIRLAKGHELAPIGRCSRFDPLKGCLGHARDDVSDNPKLV